MLWKHKNPTRSMACGARARREGGWINHWNS